MLALDARFTLFTVVCCLSTLCVLPPISVGAAVISRNAGSSSNFPSEARSIDGPSSHSKQHVLPWSSRSLQDSESEARSLMNSGSKRFNKVRTTNPIKGLADAFISHFKHGRNRKRSHKSIIIPADHGKDYLLSHVRRGATTPQWSRMSGVTNSTNGGNSTSTVQSEDSGNAGTVQIQGQSGNSSQSNQYLGSLYLTSTNGVYTLNASDKNQTLLYMANAPSPTTRSSFDSTSDQTTPVYLMIPKFQDSKDYCATYNDSPNKPEPMTMQVCNNYTAPDGSSTSQTFMFNPKSNELRPTWVDSSNSTAQAASVSNSTTTDTTSASQPSSTGLTSRGESAVNTQNVKLIWEPASNSNKVNAADISEDPDASQSASTSSTVTMTRTVTVFQTGSSSSVSSTPGSASTTGLNVEVVGQSSSSSSASPTSSISVMDVSSSTSSATPSPSVNAAAVAASIASSASASMSSASASNTSSPLVSAADFTTSASTTSTSGPSSNTFVAAVLQRSPWIKAEDR